MDAVINKSKFITIDGEIKKPGRYELFQSNMRLSDILLKMKMVCRTHHF